MATYNWVKWAQVIAWWLTAPNQYPHQCWLVLSNVLWHSPENDSIENAQRLLPCIISGKIIFLKTVPHIPKGNELIKKVHPPKEPCFACQVRFSKKVLINTTHQYINISLTRSISSTQNVLWNAPSWDDILFKRRQRRRPFKTRVCVGKKQTDIALVNRVYRTYNPRLQT